MIFLNNKKSILMAWCLYDWASASFPIIVTTFIFATYFTTKVAVDEIQGTYLWANASALAGIVIAVLSPIFGAIADHRGRQKRWLLFFTMISIVSTTLLWFAYPNVNAVYFTLTCVVFGTISLEIAHVFYNAFLLRIAPSGYIGRISGWAWGLGYLGGIINLSVALFVFVKAPPQWLDVDRAEQIRICGPWAALWFACFALPLFIIIPDVPASQLSMQNAIKKGVRELIDTIKSLPQQKNLFTYLLAHLIYVDGLNTLFAFGGIYAAGTFKMDLSSVILLGIAMNVSAGFGAMMFAWVDDYLGSKLTILISLFFLLFFGILLLLIESVTLFWCLGVLLTLFVGPVQAASRSLMARITPEIKATEYFGLYAFSGRITSFIGPWLLGLSTFYFHSQRMGMATIMLFFMVGGILMCFVREPVHASRPRLTT